MISLFLINLIYLPQRPKRLEVEEILNRICSLELAAERSRIMIEAFQEKTIERGLFNLRETFDKLVIADKLLQGLEDILKHLKELIHSKSKNSLAAASFILQRPLPLKRKFRRKLHSTGLTAAGKKTFFTDDYVSLLEDIISEISSDLFSSISKDKLKAAVGE